MPQPSDTSDVRDPGGDSRLPVVDDELLDTLAARVDEMAAARRMPADLAERLAESGFFRMLVPAEFGGGEAHPSAAVRILEQLGRVNASAAWCVMIASTTASLAGRMDPDGAADVFADPNGVWGGTYAPMGTATTSGSHLVLARSLAVGQRLGELHLVGGRRDLRRRAPSPALGSAGRGDHRAQLGRDRPGGDRIPRLDGRR